MTSPDGPGLEVSVREAAGGDWAVLRDIRLAALSESPDAFGSTYEREAAFAERDWRGRISDRSAIFFGYAGPAAGRRPAFPDGPGRPAEACLPGGLAGVVVGDGVADLVSVYIRPGARGLGLGPALIDAAAAWARSRGHRDLFLWVTEANGPARRRYDRCGFTPTGDRQPLPSDPAIPEIPEIRMSRRL